MGRGKEFKSKRRVLLQNHSIEGGSAKTQYMTLPSGSTEDLAAGEDLVASIAYDTTLEAVVVSNGSEYAPIASEASGIISDWVSYTPVLTGFGTCTDIEFESRRVGDSLEVQGKFVCGTPTAVEARASLGYDGTEGNVVSSTAKIPSIKLAGPMNTSEVSANLFSYTTLMEPTVSYVTFGVRGPGFGGASSAEGIHLVGAGAMVMLRATVPIETWP